ncbi:MAG: hypothetical protein U0892_03460 [Pirellulales bacterium]
MFLNRRTFAALACLLALSASTAFAGGSGGTKKDATIKFQNNTTATVGVAVDPSASLLSATNSTEFTARGGKLLNASDSVPIAVKAGSHRVIAVDASGNVLLDMTVNVAKGETYTVNVNPGT